MDHNTINALFQPKSTKQETKADVTTRAARAILDSETSAREKKTERLRAARMAQEAAAEPLPEKKKPARKAAPAKRAAS